jgi:hypothetical protein
MTFVDPGLGSFSGHCGGSLTSGLITGNGQTGHLEGTYLLEAGGTAGVGPYLIDLDIFET